MVTRWHARQWLQILIVTLLVGAILYGGAKASTSWSRDLPVTTAAPLAAPPQVADPGFPDPTTMTVEEYTKAIEEHVRWTSGRDSTASFTVHAQIHPDHSATITETIVQVFRSDRHGIVRRIPLETDLGSHALRSLEVATSADTPGNVKLSDIDGGIEARIGDPNTTLENAHAYRLSYLMENVVEPHGDQAIVRLDALNDWEQEVDSLEYTISADAAPVSVACFAGPVGSTSPCGTATPTADGGTFTLGDTLPAGESFTAEVVYPATAFAPAATITEQNDAATRAIVMTVVMVAAVAIGFLITVLRASRSRRRAAAAAGLSEIGGNEAPLEFVPPLDLDPASMLRLRDTWRVEVPDMLAATLVGLAADGVVTIRRDGQHTEVHRVDPAPRKLAAHEEVMLKSLFGKESDRDLATRHKAICNAIPQFVHRVDEQLREQGLTTKKKLHFGMETRMQPFTMAATFLLFVGLACALLFFVVSRWVAPVWIVTGVGGAMAIGVLAMAVRRDAARLAEYTDAGRAAVWHLEGFHRFFRDSEAIHAQAAGRLGLYREYMGYAVALGEVDRWLESMPRDLAAAMTDDELAQTRELGDVSRHRVWHQAARSYASKSASRSGGGSSGSSSSGGGVGGGGGGSW